MTENSGWKIFYSRAIRGLWVKAHFLGLQDHSLGFLVKQSVEGAMMV